MDLMKPPTPPPRRPRGACPFPTVSTAMPSRPIRLTASVPSTRSCSPVSTVLNIGTRLPARHLGQPAPQRHDPRVRARRDGFELRLHLGVVRIAGQDVLVDVPRVLDQP